MDQQFFIQVCDEVIGQRQGMNGIGTLSEKTVHSVLKAYYSPDQMNHEIKVGGFVADICTGNEIIEIQTRDFNKLRRKLTAFLTFAPVTIVYPVPNIKWLRWVNPQTGEISPPRKSPKVGSPYVIYDELYKIKDYLKNPNLHLRIVMINLEEYRFLDGWSQDKKKGSSRCDRIPTELIHELNISCLEDYQQLIPQELEDEFTSKDFKKCSGLPLHRAQTALNILHYIGTVERIGKKGNSYVYKNIGKLPFAEGENLKETSAVPDSKPVVKKKADKKSSSLEKDSFTTKKTPTKMNPSDKILTLNKKTETKKSATDSITSSGKKTNKKKIVVDKPATGSEKTKNT